VFFEVKALVRQLTNGSFLFLLIFWLLPFYFNLYPTGFVAQLDRASDFGDNQKYIYLRSAKAIQPLLLLKYKAF
jgi:hypothetical protein